MKKFFKNYGLLSIVVLAIAALGFTGHIHLDFETVATIASAYVPVNVFKTSGAPSNKQDMVSLLRLSDIVTTSLQRDDKGVLIPQNIVMKPGKYAIEVYGTIDKTAPSYETEGETDTRGLKHKLGFEHPGDSQEINEFIVGNLNENFIAITKECGSTTKKVLGTPCHPLQFIPAGQDDATAKKHMLNFEGVGRTGFTPGKYEGTITLASPLATIADDDVTPSVAAGEGQYQLGANTVATALTTLDDAVNGTVYTLLGTGGATATTIASGNDFELAGGTAWVAAAGAAITFKAFENGSGTFKFIEVSRS